MKDLKQKWWFWAIIIILFLILAYFLFAILPELFQSSKV